MRGWAVVPALLALGITHYKFRYWITNPNKEGYRMWHRAEATQGGNTVIDFAAFPSGNDATGYFTISLESYYDTGEVRSENSNATWVSESPYVTLDPLGDFTNPGASRKDTIVQIAFERSCDSQHQRQGKRERGLVSNLVYAEQHSTVARRPRSA